MITGWILAAIGLFTIVGVVVFNIGMNTRRAQRLVGLIGIAGAKIVYAILGLIMIVIGILYLTGVYPVS